MNIENSTPNPLPSEATVATPAAPAKAPGKRGRPAGSVTLANVTLAELNRLFADPNQAIPVGVKWLKATQVTAVAKSAPAAQITAAAAPEPTVAVQAGE